MKKKNTSGVSGKGMAVVAAGAAAVGAGAYYLLGPNAKEHQKKAKALMTKIETEVKSNVKKIKKVTPPLYHKAVDMISENYAKQYKMHEKDIKAFAKKLKGEWKGARTAAKKTAIKTARTLRKNSA